MCGKDFLLSLQAICSEPSSIPVQEGPRGEIYQDAVQRDGPGFSRPGCEFFRSEHAQERVPGAVHPEPRHRRPPRHGPGPGRKGEAPAGEKGRRQLCERPHFGQPALLHRHVLNRGPRPERPAGGQYFPVYELHAGFRDFDRVRHHLRNRHDPRGAHPVLLAGFHLAGGHPGLLQPHLPGHIGQ